MLGLFLKEMMFNPFETAMVGGLSFLFMFVFAFFSFGIYIYSSLALMEIAKKMKHKYPWLAWIPFANVAMVLQLGGFHWAFVFLFLIPIFGWGAIAVLNIICFWRIFEKFKYNGAWSLLIAGLFIPMVGWMALVIFLVLLGVLAWGKEVKTMTKLEQIFKKKSVRKKKK